MKNQAVLEELWSVINDRAAHPSPDSYVSSLLTHRKGIDKPLEKVGEEATEFILAVKNGEDNRTIEEGADLLFHFLVALKAAEIDIEDVLGELAARRK
ncbi:phosphoribosyl-ATP pyrophosphohydrolase [Methanofollis sp. W23]|uniref:phosphoribosyl-ATP diphosphatase n=1 Tax=Methanofollis sp. W23 TaxID=2817849 RepID=UPI001AE27E75|nr:phosphoribosyl-ATP diphosphatase [Methanofollis sp. W23]MBP2147116.1 phosphoribosyl-ATP pyrophosphohydrolase [Methanofollis sp. W23]